jgi:hypothetical protein
VQEGQLGDMDIIVDEDLRNKHNEHKAEILNVAQDLKQRQNER